MPEDVIVRGQKIGPSITARSNCALLKIRKDLQGALATVETEIEMRMERKTK